MTKQQFEKLAALHAKAMKATAKANHSFSQNAFQAAAKAEEEFQAYLKSLVAA